MTPCFGRFTSGPSSYHSPLQSPSHGYAGTLPNPLQSHQFTEGQKLLSSQDLDGRPFTSSAYSMPPSSIPERNPDRPATAPVTISQLMPPKRELPFPKEPVKSATDRIAQAQGECETTDNTASQKATKTTKSRAKGKAKAQMPTRSSSRAKPKPSYGQTPAKNRALLPKPGLDSMPQAIATLETVLPPGSPPKLPATKPVMTNTSQSIINTRNKSLVVIEESAPVPKQFSGDFENIGPEEYMDRLDHWVRKYQDLPAPKPVVKPTSTDTDPLAAYAVQPEDKRLEALDNMICDYLDDENFVQLVEDVDNSWRRIGLGF